MTITRVLVDRKRDVTNSDYDAIESAIMESSRGRWFLSEYARRNRYAETKLLLLAIYNSLAYHANQIGAADVSCKNKRDNSDLRGPWPRSQEEFVSRY